MIGELSCGLSEVRVSQLSESTKLPLMNSWSGIGSFKQARDWTLVLLATLTLIALAQNSTGTSGD